MINNSSILITGGSGFFADAFVKSVMAQEISKIKRLCLFSRNEARQAERRREYENTFADWQAQKLRYFIGDVRDQDRLTRAMDNVDIVIHAAALKRIEVAEYNIMEAVSTNVMGTVAAVKAAIDSGVKRFVLLSTDKAVNPTTTYGLTKALAENVVLKGGYMAEDSPRRPWSYQTMFAVCRYGNVMGSTGSVIPTWRAMKAAGQKVVPISNPEATRYWLSAEDAIDLVLGAIYHHMEPGPGALFLRTDYPAFRLADLAQALELETRTVGMPAGEKLHEEMLMGASSKDARRLSVDEIREKLKEV